MQIKTKELLDMPREETIDEENLCKELIGATINDAYIVGGILKMECTREETDFKVRAKLRMLDHGDIVYSRKKRKVL